MKILINTQYFWPETFRINDVVIFLEERGYSVDILTGKPNYPDGSLFKEYRDNPSKFETYSKSRIYRIPIFLRGKSTSISLFFNYCSYVMSAIFFGTFILRNKKYDVIITFATSPITVAIPGIYFSWIKNTKHILWVLDLWPDILKELNILKNQFIFIFLNKIVNYIYNKADIILAQSKSFQKIISSRTKDKSKTIYFPSWSEEITEKKILDQDIIESGIYKNKFNIVFTGNLGDAQNFDKIIDSAELLKDHDDIQWIIIGSGRRLDSIKDEIKKRELKNFILLGYRPASEMSFFHNIASILLVSLKSGNYLSCTIPGKLSTYMESNKFILGFLNGEAAELIKKSKVGMVVHPDNAAALANKIVELKNNPELISRVAINNYGSRYVSKYLNKKNILLTLIENLKKINRRTDNFKVISSVNDIPYNINFSLSGLNLAFLGYYIQKRIILTDDTFLWPDGIFFNRFFYNKLKKIAGRNLIKNISMPERINRVFVFGNLEEKSFMYLKNLYKKKTIHVPLGFESVKVIHNKQCNYKFLETDVIFITLPTPKQEELAQLIMNNNKFFKIFCVGGAINMASGLEKPVPYIFDLLNLEFLWRLKTDTSRRVKRIIVSGYYYFKGELLGKFKDVNKIIFNEKK